MKTIYNEGRVVGMSQYEIYVRHLLSEDPTASLPSEREWLASTLGNGASMILKISEGTSQGYHDYPLPSTSSLCIASTIVGTLFTGSVQTDADDRWAVTVTNYSPLIPNNHQQSPSTPGQDVSTVPVGDTSQIATQNILDAIEYLKIGDGVTYQPGTWTPIVGGTVAKSFVPDLSGTGVVRLYFSEEINRTIYILFTGFMFKPIIEGTTLLDTPSISTEHPDDGDFLGSTIYPWATKISFMMSSTVLSNVFHRMYSRRIADESTATQIDTDSVIDFERVDPAEYYINKYADSIVALAVDKLNILQDSLSSLTLFQQDSRFPGALYGSKITQEGQNTLAPVDIAAPGTIKVFETEEEALAYPKVVPNTYSIYKDGNEVYIIDKDTQPGSFVPLNASVETTQESGVYKAKVTAGEDTVSAVSLKDTSGNDLNLSGSSGISSSSDYITWETLLKALADNKKIDVLLDSLRSFRSNLPDVSTAGVLNLTGTGASSVGGDFSAPNLSATTNISAGNDVTATNNITATKTVSGQDVTASHSYITLNGKRLYISSSNPGTSGVPIGSIGIGW